MLVIAAIPGLKVPKEDKPREYITDTAPEGEVGFTVPDSVYYQRRVLEGDLIDVEAALAAAAVAKPRKGGA